MAHTERKRILIWGKTRPELSKTYTETVCTGGVLEETRRLIRLYPIPLRYMDADSVFRKYQWIEADIYPSDTDQRPESYKIRPDTIVPGEVIPTKSGNWSERTRWVMNPGNVFRSVEALQEAQRRDRTSLGLVKPAGILGYTYETVPEAEKGHFRRLVDALRSKGDLFDDDPAASVRPLSPPDFRFKIRFRCDDPACGAGHEFSVLDWEIDALYFRLRSRRGSPEQARDEVLRWLEKLLDPGKKDTHFFLGNISSHPQNFTIVGLWYPKQERPADAVRPPRKGRASASRRRAASPPERTLFDPMPG
jgi:hypothetical protein